MTCHPRRVTEVEGRQFGRYRVVATLGRGAMGEVYAAIDDVLGREVAIKTLRGVNGELSARMFDERFRHEARAIASLAHPGVVQVFDVDIAASPPFLVMERVAGPSLAARLDDGPLAIDEVRALGVQIGHALAAAHERGIVHRDVKPANILAAGAGRWKLADFGVAHVPDSSLTLTGQFVGSPAYAAPEALTRGQLGPPGDVYGLGAVLYQAACGRWPRSEPSSPGIAALLAPPPSLIGLAPHVPPALAAAIERALDPDPTKRPTAAELAAALAGERVLPTPLPAPAAAVSLPAPTVAPMHAAAAWRHRAPWIAVGVALLIGIAIGVGQRGGSGGSATVTPASVVPPVEPAWSPLGAGSEDGLITARTPPNLTGKSGKDWDKIVQKLYNHDLAEARDKLAEFERKYGRSAETADLAAQLDRFAAQPGWSRGRRGKHDD
jgi:tRNA A-37 threonylcarbamoyl transferase component Bud32